MKAFSVFKRTETDLFALVSWLARPMVTIKHMPTHLRYQRATGIAELGLFLRPPSSAPLLGLGVLPLQRQRLGVSLCVGPSERGHRPTVAVVLVPHRRRRRPVRGRSHLCVDGYGGSRCPGPNRRNHPLCFFRREGLKFIRRIFQKITCVCVYKRVF